MHDVLYRYNRVQEHDLISLYESRRDKPAELEAITAGIMEAIMNTGKEGYDGPQMNIEDISLRLLWEATVGPVHKTLTEGRRKGLIVISPVMEAVDTSAFPKITGALIAKTVIAAYESPAYIGENLVTNMPSKLKLETITGFNDVGGLKEVLEGKEYQYTGLTERYVTSEAKKAGRLIAVTEEMVMLDQTGKVINKARAIGDRARLDKEKKILGCIIDLTGYKRYYPSGTSTALYATGNTVASNALVDWTDVNNARKKLAGQTDSEGEPILVPKANLLVPDALLATANYITQSVEVRTASAVHILKKPPLPIGTVYSSALLDNANFGNDTTTWYYGDFKNQFVWHEILPIQVLTRAGDSDNKWMRDINTEFKVRHFGACAATDNKRVIKNTA